SSFDLPRSDCKARPRASAYLAKRVSRSSRGPNSTRRATSPISLSRSCKVINCTTRYQSCRSTSNRRSKRMTGKGCFSSTCPNSSQHAELKSYSVRSLPLCRKKERKICVMEVLPLLLAQTQTVAFSSRSILTERNLRKFSTRTVLMRMHTSGDGLCSGHVMKKEAQSDRSTASRPVRVRATLYRFRLLHPGFGEEVGDRDHSSLQWCGPPPGELQRGVFRHTESLWSTPVTAPEKLIRDHLAANLEILEPEHRLSLVATEFHISNPQGADGFIDVLAKDAYETWVVIELNRSDSSARQALHEIAKYTELLRREKSLPKDRVRSIIVSTSWN